MPIDFPSNPFTNQTYTYNNKTWKYNGQGWVVIDASVQTIGKYVEEINGITGGITLSAGTGIDIGSSPKNISITNTGVRTINGFTGNIGFSAGAGISLSKSGNTFTIISLGTPTVEAITSINFMGGPGITIAGGDSIEITSSSNTVTVFNRGVTSINGLTGIVGLSAGRGITLVGSGRTLTIENFGVLSINGITANVGLSAGRGISLFGSGRTLTIENFGVVSINGITANVGLSAASDNVTISSVGRTLTISVSGVGGGVSSLNQLTGAVTATGEGAIIAPIISGQNIIFRTRLGQEWNGVTGATGVNNYNCAEFIVTGRGTVLLRGSTPTVECINGLNDDTGPGGVSQYVSPCDPLINNDPDYLCDGTNLSSCTTDKPCCSWLVIGSGGGGPGSGTGTCVCTCYGFGVGF